MGCALALAPIEPWGSDLTFKPLYGILALLTTLALLLALRGGARCLRQAEHRLRARRRPGEEPRRVHAARPADAAQGMTFSELLRHRLAVLPVALVDLHRAGSRTTPASSQQRRRRRLRDASTRNGDETATFATALQAAGYRTAMMGKYLNGYTAAGPRRPQALRAAGLERVGRRRQRLPGVQLRAQRERHVVHYGAQAAGLPDRRARRRGGSASSTARRRPASRS